MQKIGKVEKYIQDKIAKEGAVLVILIDPCDYQSPQKAIETAVLASKAGVDVISIGGSTEAQGQLLDEVTKGIKEKIKTPTLLFPGNIATISSYADAIMFMSLLNSRNPYWISQAQMLAAPVIRKSKIEPIPIGYILVSPGGTAGWVGDANLIPRNKPKIASALALSAEYSGQRMVYTDVGSASPEHVPLEMISMVSKTISVPYIVGGGIKNPEQAGKVVEAGADVLFVGTAAENSKDVKKLVGEFVKIIKEKGKEKLKNK
ncbi:MAG: geranylgeranylglyceryl/heptaprenylglyceryl phosphate synthase [Patescibacteria group bacterium]